MDEKPLSPLFSICVCVNRGEGGVTKSKLCKLCGEDMVSTKAFVHFIKHHLNKSRLCYSRRRLETTSHRQLTFT